MKHPKAAARSQRGMTFVGLCIVMMVFGGYVLFILTAFPLYRDYLTVKSIMVNMAAEPPEVYSTKRKVLDGITKRADINSLDVLYESSLRRGDTVVEVETNKKTKVNTLHVIYRAENGLFKNFKLLIDVHEKIELATGQTETITVTDEDEK